MDPERARQRLKEERERIAGEVAAIGQSPAGSDEPEDTGDQAVELDQAERDAAIRNELQRTLAAIERAEQRLDDGSYGVSVVSGEPIPEERLEALPWADRLVGEER